MSAFSRYSGEMILCISLRKDYANKNTEFTVNINGFCNTCCADFCIKYIAAFSFAAFNQYPVLFFVDIATALK